MDLHYLFPVVLLAFFFVFLLLNYYIVVRVRRIFGWKGKVVIRKVAGWVLVAIVSMFVIVSFFGDSRLVMIIVPLWIVGFVYLFSGLVLADVICRYASFDYRKIGRVAVIGVAVLMAYGVWNAYDLDVKEVVIPIEGLSSPVTLVHLSDVHMGDLRGRGSLVRLVSKVNDIGPDYVVITGDFFDGSDSVDESTVAPLKDISCEVFFAPGNHELYFGKERARELLTGAGVNVLSNEVVVRDGLQIVGTDYSGNMFYTDNPNLRDIDVDDSMPSVLLYHPPFGVYDALDAGIDLQLSGHTHGGQIFPFSLVTGSVYPNLRGLYEFDGMKLYVTDGIGTFGPPMRIGTDSEIAVIRLVPLE